jgi:hypothetical protein
MKHRGSNVNDTRQLRETRHARPADRLDAFYVALFSGECRGAMGIAAGVARTDQSLGHYDASVRAHVDRRFPRVTAFQAAC